jgi:branched-chain amino acid transport system substrate-binding protein
MARLRLMAAAAALVVVSCTNPIPTGSTASGQTIEIASEFPISGPLTFPSLDRMVAIAFAEHPSVEGYHLVHVTLDDALGGVWDIDRAIQNMRRAVGEPSILAVDGPWISFQAQALIPLAAQAGLVVLSPSNTLDCLTEAPTCLESPRQANSPTTYFRVASRDTLMARAAADFAIHKLGISRFAVLTSPIDTPFAQPMSTAFSEEVAALGGLVVYTHDFFPLAPSFAPTLRAARAAGAQAVYASAGVDPTCAIRRDMAGIFPADAYLLSGDRVADDGCIQAAGLEGQTDDHFVLTLGTAQPRTIPDDLKVLDKGHGFDIYTLAAYDCANILIDAVGRAIRANGGRLPTREQVRAALGETHYKGITGTYSFDANGDVTNPGFSFYTIQRGSWTYWRSP